MNEIALSLADLKDAVTLSYSKMQSKMQETTGAAFELGSYLQKARNKFNSDQDFGQWREENTPVSADMSSRLMQVHREYGELPKEGVIKFPISTLREMIPLPPKVKQELLDREEPPTVKEVRQIKSGDVTDEDDVVVDPTRAEIAKERAEERKAKARGDILTLEQRCQIDMKLSLEERLEKYSQQVGGDEALRAFGLCEFAEYLPHEEVIKILYEKYTEEIQDEGQLVHLELAYEEILICYDNERKENITVN